MLLAIMRLCKDVIDLFDHDMMVLQHMEISAFIKRVNAALKEHAVLKDNLVAVGARILLQNGCGQCKYEDPVHDRTVTIAW